MGCCRELSITRTRQQTRQHLQCCKKPNLFTRCLTLFLCMDLKRSSFPLKCIYFHFVVWFFIFFSLFFLSDPAIFSRHVYVFGYGFYVGSQFVETQWTKRIRRIENRINSHLCMAMSNYLHVFLLTVSPQFSI